MKKHHYSSYSQNLGRTMEFDVFGSGGRICLVFPSQNGRYYDFENFGMTDTVAKWIDSSRLRLFCVDSIDNETWSNSNGDPRTRLELHEKWYHYITDELFPLAQEINGTPQKAIVTGCSMGGVHAGTFFFRRPDLFDTMLSLSGLFNAQYFIPGYMDDLLYNNSPVHFLVNMPEDHPYMELYRQSRIILCVGQGAWEEDLLAGTRHLDSILQAKNIPAWVDYWGFDVSHDWPWWRKQLPYFMDKILG